MSVKLASSRFIVSSVSKSAALYQRLFKNLSGFQDLGERLIYEAKKAFAFRQTEILEEIGLLLSNLPSQEHQLIGQYYQGWCAYQKGETPKAVFENVVEKSQTYKAIALMSLAALEARNGDYTSEMSYFIEAIKRAESPTTFIRASKAIAVIKAKEGYRQLALRDLENLIPLLRYASADVYFDSLNSLAVELGEAGRIEEARNICKVVLASPYVFAYPEWRETGNEVTLRGYKSRSSVSVTRAIPKNVLYLPEPSPLSDTPIKLGRGRLFSLEKWKEKMVKEPNGNGEELPENMQAKDMVLKLLNLATQDDVSEEDLRKVLDYAIKVFSRKDK